MISLEPDILVIQALNGLATASSLFLVASGLSIIFGVTRVVNFAHGSFYMLGAYIGWSLTRRVAGFGAFGFWGSVVVAALLVGVLGVIVEMLILRRLRRAPELYPLLATFGIVLIVRMPHWRSGGRRISSDLARPGSPASSPSSAAAFRSTSFS